VKPGFGLGVGAVALAAVIWGAQFPIGKSAFTAIDPVSLNVARYVMSALLIAGVLAAREGMRAVSFGGRFLPLVGCGLIGMCFSPLLVFGGLVFARPEHVAIIIATQPSMTALAQWWVRGTRPSRTTLMCVAAAFAGVALVVTRGRLSIEGTAQELLGDALVVGGAACWVAYTMLSERREGLSTLRFTTLVLIGGMLGNLAALAVALGFGWLAFPSRAAWLSVGPEVLYLGLCGIFVAMTLWNFGTQRVGSLNALLFTNLIPVVTFAIGYAQGHRFETVEIAGAALVVSALVANNLAERHRRVALPLQ
jgi:drug/metabolite transporter (DMT)-like permease